MLPYHQHTLERSNKPIETGPGKEHPRHLCGKCKQLGRYCGDTEEEDSLVASLRQMNLR